eukprot:6185426-Pleurochrysis_carterae.AAC.3
MLHHWCCEPRSEVPSLLISMIALIRTHFPVPRPLGRDQLGNHRVCLDLVSACIVSSAVRVLLLFAVDATDHHRVRWTHVRASVLLYGRPEYGRGHRRRRFHSPRHRGEAATPLIRLSRRRPQLHSPGLLSD